MSRLKVLLRGTQISDLDLSPDREYIGGRKESCDIRLQPEKGISREHFKLKFEDGRWVLMSLSRFGEIFSLGQRVESAPLEHGQIFQIPPYEFMLSDVPEAIGENIVSEAPQADENERTVIGVAQQVPYIKMMSSGGEVREMLRLEVGDVWAAGRDPSCQIIIPDQRVSRRQFEVRKINGIYMIIDLNSVNGTFLNGSPISGTDPQPLKSGDAITVLDNTMYFELHDPNFQYRMERIEVPPLPVNQPMEDVEEIAEPVSDMEYIEEIDDASADDMMNYPQEYAPESGSPFTGVSFDQIPPIEPQPQAMPAEPPLNAWKRFTQNKPVFISVVILLLIGAYFLSEMLNPPPEPQKAAQVVDPNDPLSKLNQQERESIELWYTTAEQSLRQNKWEVARESLDKIHKILPTGYKDSKLFEEEALNGEQTMLMQTEAARREKEQAETDALIKSTLEKCEKSIVPETTIEGIRDCLLPVTNLDPANTHAQGMIDRVTKTIADRQSKEDSERLQKSQQEELQAVFDKAEEVHQGGFPKKTIKAYQDVIDAPLPDPNGLKEVAENRIKLIQKKLKQRNTNNVVNAESFIKDGKLKEAILALRAAQQFSPDDQEIKDKIERYSNDLRNQVKVLYQESVIDENFGNVDGLDNRPGAKDKWKKIIELDLDDGDYYRKAYIKLKRYGVF